jgi:hypothetical protein
MQPKFMQAAAVPGQWMVAEKLKRRFRPARVKTAPLRDSPQQYSMRKLSALNARGNEHRHAQPHAHGPSQGTAQTGVASGRKDARKGFHDYV